MSGTDETPASGSPSRGSGLLFTSAGYAGLSWMVSLPVLAAGSACFWSVGSKGPIPAPVCAAVSSLLVLAAFTTAASVQLSRWLSRRATSRLPLLMLRALAVGLISLVLAAFLGMMPWLHVEAISPFDRSFEQGHLLAVSVVSLAAVSAWVYASRAEGKSGAVRLTGAAILAIVGVVAWYRVSAFAYDTVRGSYADSAILLLHTVALIALLLACVVNAVLAARQTS